MTEESRAEIIEALRNEPRKLAHHVLQCTDLPDVLASGGLLSAGECGNQSEHWGSNWDLGRNLVCFSFALTEWGYQRQRLDGKELVVLSAATADLISLPGALLCPLNSGAADARRYLEGKTQQDSTVVKEFLSKPGKSEILVPAFVSFRSFDYLTFIDDDSKSFWWPVVKKWCLGNQHKPPVACKDANFRPQHIVRERVRPMPIGVNRRRISPTEVERPRFIRSSPVSLEQLREELRLLDGEGDEPIDLFEERFCETGDRKFEGDFTDWPDNDDEPLDPGNLSLIPEPY